MKRLILTFLVSLFFILPAMAGSDHNVCFSLLDENMDGTVTVEEFSAVFPDEESVFKNADSDGNGMVVHDEWEGYKEHQGFEETHGDS